MRYRRFGLVLAALTVFAAACGDTDDHSAPADGMDHDMAGDASSGYNFGAPAKAGEATRVIEVEAHDTLMFQPASVTVDIDEVVTFRVTNTGELNHDFTLGDEQLQARHDEEMASMGDGMMMTMEDEPNAFSLPAGETKELTWHFDRAGTVIFGCHIPGHYAAGMRGEIDVS